MAGVGRKHCSCATRPLSHGLTVWPGPQHFPVLNPATVALLAHTGCSMDGHTLGLQSHKEL